MAKERKQIVAIGGCGFTAEPKNLALDRFLIKVTGKKHPKVTFLPQASAEDQRYVAKFYAAYTELGAEPSWQSLFGRVADGWEEKLLSQDLIYVGGGNTRSMLVLWKEWGLDKVLRQAWEKGIVLAGVSAGGICWFEQGVTDSVWPLGVLECLGFLKGSCCPHYDGEAERRPTYLKMMDEGRVLPGLALEDGVAAHFVGTELKQIVTCRPEGGGFQVSRNGEVTLERVAL